MYLTILDLEFRKITIDYALGKILCLVSENPLSLMLNEQTTHLYLSQPLRRGSTKFAVQPHSAMARWRDDIGCD